MSGQQPNATAVIGSMEGPALPIAVRGRTQPAADKFFLTGKDCCPHRRCTKPYSPQTNGKAERFIQTALREWAYAKHWTNSQERNLHLRPWNDYYNRERPHLSLNYKPLISRSDTGATS